MDEQDDIQRRMDEAAAALDFEEARRLRDMLNLMRGGASRAEAERADTAGLERQQPGAMGLGTSQQRVTPPPGWTPPRKPDPLTAGRSRRGGKQRGGPRP
ncbi:excinuclease ABC subunit B [Sphingomonas parva]|uniref:Excinuclease ABC subunit B n=1 Tax=Sphingomonas parva TaxID=2555898 RepID=A0A4Y8ZTQ0_9SPHN|nr:UvrB/UvrC motif-containing protein [Sphingomonas parva]TFI59294.1 excinuclease ABC subunit B [Sphingomonas parva]